jgi:hypothetical protein
VCNGASGGVPATSFDDATFDPTAAPNVAQGLFIDGVNGNDTTGTGSPQAPFKTLAAGLPTAQSLGHTSVYLAEATYSEHVTLPAGSALFIEGGWINASGSWHRDCATGANASTVIGRGVVSSVVSGGLRSLTVQASGAQTNIAVRVAAGKLIVLDSALLAGAGGSGEPNGTTSSTTCGGQNGSASTGGAFASDGSFVPGSGQPGTNGCSGTAGYGASGKCYYGHTFEGFATCGYQSDGYDTDVVQGGAAGYGGYGGFSGGGGGASVALSVGSGASANVMGSTLSAQNGGNGYPGGAGSAGGAGGAAQSATYTCSEGGTDDPTNCVVIYGTMTLTSNAGTDGSPGGAGGGGAGGPSISLAEYTAGSVATDANTTLNFGTGGTGAGGAANGVAVATLTEH